MLLVLRWGLLSLFSERNSYFYFIDAEIEVALGELYGLEAVGLGLEFRLFVLVSNFGS